MKRKIAAIALILVLIPQNANAKEIKYVKQKAGQFCAIKDIKNTVTLPTGSKLVCTKEGSRARWKNS
jgi:hypothetical protein